MNVPLLALPVETTTTAISLVLEFGVFQQNWPKAVLLRTDIDARFAAKANCGQCPLLDSLNGP